MMTNLLRQARDCGRLLLEMALLVAAAIAAWLWLRSPTRVDRIDYVRPPGVDYSMYSYPGGVTFGRSSQITIDGFDHQFAELHSGLNLGSDLYRTKIWICTNVTAPEHFIHGRRYLGTNWSQTEYVPNPPKSTRGGFAWEGDHYDLGWGPFDVGYLSVPFWFLTLTPLAFPIARTVIVARRQRRRRTNRCGSCGYDLRGSPGRCPECGTVPADAASGQPARP